MVDGTLTSETALVYTTPQEAYSRSAIDLASLRDSHALARRELPHTEGYALLSEATDLGGHVWQTAMGDDARDIDSSALEVADLVRRDPSSYRLLLDDVRAGRPWPLEVISLTTEFGYARRIATAKHAYDLLRSALETDRSG